MHLRFAPYALVLPLAVAFLNSAAFATTPTVTITSPANNSQTTSPINFVGSASSPDCAQGISAMRIYSAPGVEANTVAGGKLDSYINLPVGTYHTTVVAWDNCGGVGSTDVTVTTTSVTPPGGFLYTVNSNWLGGENNTNTLNFVEGFSIVAGKGALALTGQGPVNTNIDPLSAASDSGGYRLYVGDFDSGDVFPYFINRSNGYLTPVPGAPFAVNRSVTAVAVHPNGKLIFATRDEYASGDGVAVFELQSNGSLVQAPGSPYTTELAPQALVVDPSGKYLYVADGSGYIDAFEINTSTSALTPVSGSPFKLTIPSNCEFTGFPTDIIDFNGKQLYSADSSIDSISGYSIGSAGGLTQISGSPWADNGGCQQNCPQCASNPDSLAVDGTGKFLYAHDGDMSEISIYSVGTNGTLTFVKNVDQAQIGGLGPIRTDSTGNYLYTWAGNGLFGYASIMGFSINHTTGDLTVLPTSPYNYPLPSSTNNYGYTYQAMPLSFTVTR
jgi:6-phosphogluconolactonase (cycloisomerase 2 family)